METLLATTKAAFANSGTISMVLSTSATNTFFTLQTWWWFLQLVTGFASRVL
jgi:hypothetical protein